MNYREYGKTKDGTRRIIVYEKHGSTVFELQKIDYLLFDYEWVLENTTEVISVVYNWCKTYGIV